MVMERVEEKLGTALRQIRQMQLKLTAIQKQAEALLQESELSARDSINKLMDNGLTLIGKGLTNGRKVKESFVAETHRKAKKFEKTILSAAADPVSVTEVIPPEKKSGSVKPKARKATKPAKAKVHTKSVKHKASHSTRAH